LPEHLDVGACRHAIRGDCWNVGRRLPRPPCRLCRGTIGSASQWPQVQKIHRGDAEIAEARRATQSPCCPLRDLCVLGAFAVRTASHKARIGCRYFEPLDSHF
jgi:hypothetical protein